MSKEWAIFKTNHMYPESERFYDKLSQNNNKILDRWLYDKSIKSKSTKRAEDYRIFIL